MHVHVISAPTEKQGLSRAVSSPAGSLWSSSKAAFPEVLAAPGAPVSPALLNRRASSKNKHLSYFPTPLLALAPGWVSKAVRAAAERRALPNCSFGDGSCLDAAGRRGSSSRQEGLLTGLWSPKRQHRPAKTPLPLPCPASALACKARRTPPLLNLRRTQSSVCHCSGLDALRPPDNPY